MQRREKKNKKNKNRGYISGLSWNQSKLPNRHPTSHPDEKVFSNEYCSLKFEKSYFCSYFPIQENTWILDGVASDYCCLRIGALSRYPDFLAVSCGDYVPTNGVARSGEHHFHTWALYWACAPPSWSSPSDFMKVTTNQVWPCRQGNCWWQSNEREGVWAGPLPWGCSIKDKWMSLFFELLYILVSVTTS